MSHFRASPGSRQGRQISPEQNINMADKDSFRHMLCGLFKTFLNRKDRKLIPNSNVNSFFLHCLSHSKFHISRESLSIFCIFLLCCPSFTSLNHPCLHSEAVAFLDKGPCPPQPFMAASAVVMETQVPRTLSYIRRQQNTLGCENKLLI